MDIEWPGHFPELMASLPSQEVSNAFEIECNLTRLWEAMEIYRRKLAERVRAAVKVPVTEAYATSGHSNRSQHYIGKACDCRAYRKDRQGLWQLIPLSQQYETALAAGPFRGIGAYPDWRRGAGLHLDIRDGADVAWVRVAGVYHYRPSVSTLMDVLAETCTARSQSARA